MHLAIVSLGFTADNTLPQSRNISSQRWLSKEQSNSGNGIRFVLFGTSVIPASNSYHEAILTQSEKSSPRTTLVPRGRAPREFAGNGRRPTLSRRMHRTSSGPPCCFDRCILIVTHMRFAEQFIWHDVIPSISSYRILQANPGNILSCSFMALGYRAGINQGQLEKPLEQGVGRCGGAAAGQIQPRGRAARWGQTRPVSASRSESSGN